jgi:hypothetical protein
MLEPLPEPPLQVRFHLPSRPIHVGEWPPVIQVRFAHRE